MKMKLSDRLQAVYDMVTEGSVVADVGCDHAFLSIALVSDGRSPEAYAMDVNKGPLEKAEHNIAEAGLKTRIHTLLSNGLTELTKPVDTIVICGMGGSLILDILSESITKVRTARELILSPQSDIKKVREWLCGQGFSMVEERMVKDSGKYYTILKIFTDGNCAGWGEKTDFEMKYGPYLLKNIDKVFYEYLGYVLNRYKNILKNLRCDNIRYSELKCACDYISKVRVEYDMRCERQ